mgnify:CR=1 FL=1
MASHVDRVVAVVSVNPAPSPGLLDRFLVAADAEDIEAIVVLNKVDLLSDRYELELWSQAFSERGISILSTSALTGESTVEVLREVLRVIDLGSAPEPGDDQDWSPI